MIEPGATARQHYCTTSLEEAVMTSRRPTIMHCCVLVPDGTVLVTAGTTGPSPEQAPPAGEGNPVHHQVSNQMRSPFLREELTLWE